MNWLLKLFLLWLAVDALIIATVWYATTVLKSQWPDWWRRVVADEWVE